MLGDFEEEPGKATRGGHHACHGGEDGFVSKATGQPTPCRQQGNVPDASIAGDRGQHVGADRPKKQVCTQGENTFFLPKPIECIEAFIVQNCSNRFSFESRYEFDYRERGISL